MDLSSYFLLPDGRLRAGWRLLLFVVVFLGTATVVRAAVFSFFDPAEVPQTWALAAYTLSGLSAAVAVTWLLMRRLEHLPFAAVGLARKESGKYLAFGLGGGVFLVGAVTVTEWAAGGVHFQPVEVPASFAILLLADSGILMISAAYEELLFRGYPFQRLLEGTNAFAAVAISSVLFGLLHAANPHATRLSILNTVLAGVLLSLAYLKTRALWLPLGFHFSWNWTLALLGLPVSGVELAQMPWQAIPSAERIWLHGGEYGPEGGVIASVALAGGVLYVAAKRTPVFLAAPPPATPDTPPRIT